MSYAQITLVGRLGRDPEMKMTAAGKSITTTAVAVTVGKDKQTNWYVCNAWDNMGKWLNDATKGDMIFVQGDLEVRHYDKKDGTKGTELTVTARAIRTMGGKRQESQASAPVVDFDDVPF
jgi:single-strand DNA-binding protein